MKKMKRLLVAMLSCLTAFACVAGLAACGDDDSSSSSTQKPAASSSSVTSTVESSSVEESSSVVESSSEEESSSVEESSKVEESSSAKDPAEHVHTWLREPTCLNNGECTECGIVEQSMLGHSIASWTTEKEPTCTAEGSQIGLCARCGITVTEGLPKLGHNFKEVEAAIAATCTEAGKTAVEKCSRCEATQGGEEVEATGHTPEAVADVAATCTEEGLTGKTICSVCNEVVDEGEVVDALGHTWKDGIEPSCTESGECTVCGETVAATGHAKSVLKPQIVPTCETTGTTTYYYECPVCHEIDKDLTPSNYKVVPAGHLYGTYVGQKIDASFYADTTYVSYSSGKIEVDDAHAASCEHGAVCYRCGETVTAKADHQYKIVQNSEGYYSYVVENCEDDGFYAWNVARKDEDGNVIGYDCYAKECVFCHATTAEEVKATGHKWAWTRVEKAATCKEEGTLAHGKCTNPLCEVEEGTETIEATGHNIKTKATCTENAVCYDCGEVEDTALGHDYSVVVEGQEPTCTEIGWCEHNICKICGAIEDYEELEALGHTYIFVPAEANSCVDAGKKAYFSCSNVDCELLWNATKSNTETEFFDGENYYKVGTATKNDNLVVKATGHSFLRRGSVTIEGNEYSVTDYPYIAAVLAKCETEGKTEGGFCKNCNTYIDSVVVGALGHDGDRAENCDEEGNFAWLSKSSRQATCTKEAYCGLCSKSQSKWVDPDGATALAHSYEEKESYTARSATCQYVGYSRDFTVCSCGQVYVDGDMVKTYKTDKNGDFVLDDNGGKIPDANWKLNDVTIAKKAHSYDVTIAAKAPTCTEAGWNEYYICRFCGAEKGSIKTIDKLGHCNADEGKTCQESFFCDRIIGYETDEDGEFILGADGQKQPIYCEKAFLSEKPAKAHSYEKRDTGTVDEKGNTVYAYICTGCGAKKED